MYIKLTQLQKIEDIVADTSAMKLSPLNLVQYYHSQTNQKKVKEKQEREEERKTGNE